MKWFKVEKDYKIGKVSYKVMTEFMFGDYKSEQDGVEMYIMERQHRKRNWSAMEIIKPTVRPWESWDEREKALIADVKSRNIAIINLIPSALDDAKSLLIDRINKITVNE